MNIEVENIELKENSQAWLGNSRRTTSRFSSCEPTSLSNLCDHLWEGFFGNADADAEADTDADAYTFANAVGDGLPLHGIPIPPEPREIGNCDRPKRGVPEEVIQCVPVLQILISLYIGAK